MDIIKINTSNSTELPLLVGLLSQQLKDIGSVKSRSAIESAVLNALKPESRSLFFLGKEKATPIGLVFLNICSGIESEGDYVWINEIQISPEYRGRGFGTELLNHVLAWCHGNDIKKVLGIAGLENAASQTLFRTAGFTIDDVKWMQKNLELDGQS